MAVLQLIGGVIIAAVNSGLRAVSARSHILKKSRAIACVHPA
jgi:hypothetical protein